MILEANRIEQHTEELQFNGLSLKFFVSLDTSSKNYTVNCKAYDNHHSLLWATELLDQNGKPLTFHSLGAAVTKTRSIFSVYKKESSNVR
jgi:hypothetical protein